MIICWGDPRRARDTKAVGQGGLQPMAMGCFRVGRGGPRGLDLLSIDGLVPGSRLSRGWTVRRAATPVQCW